MKYIYSIVFALVVFLSAASFANAQSMITYNLKLGMRADAQVVVLQNFLMSKGFLGSGNATGNFGPLTFSAVRNYQTASGINSTGFVGPLTRSAINTALAGGSNTPVGFVPGCTSYSGFSPLTGQSCALGVPVSVSALAVTPVQVSNIAANTAYLASSFSAPVSGYYTVRFEYAQTPDAFTNGYQTKIGQIILSGQSGSFTASLTNLVAGQTYFVRAVAENTTYGRVTSNVVSFVASNVTAPVAPIAPNYQNQNTAQTGQPYVGTNSAALIGDTTATISGSFDGRGSSTSVYFQYWFGLSSVSSTGIASGGSGTGTASFNLINLIPGMTYSYRIVAQNMYGTVYGSTMQFTTNQQMGNSNNGGYQAPPAPSNTCANTMPVVTAAFESVSSLISAGQIQAPVLGFRVLTNCDVSLKSLSFSGNPATALTALSDLKVYFTGNSSAITGTFSGGTFTLSVPIVIPAGGYRSFVLKGNTPVGASGSVSFGLNSLVAQSVSGVVNQYAASVSSGSLTYNNPSSGGTPPPAPSGGSNTGTPVINPGIGSNATLLVF